MREHFTSYARVIPPVVSFPVFYAEEVWWIPYQTQWIQREESLFCLLEQPWWKSLPLGSNCHCKWMGIVKVQTTRMRGIPVYVLFGTRAWGIPGRFITGTQLVARIHRAYDLSGSNWISIYGPYTFKYGPCILRSLRDWPHSHSPRKDAASYIRASSYKRQLPAVIFSFPIIRVWSGVHPYWIHSPIGHVLRIHPRYKWREERLLITRVVWYFSRHKWNI